MHKCRRRWGRSWPMGRWRRGMPCGTALARAPWCEIMRYSDPASLSRLHCSPAPTRSSNEPAGVHHANRWSILLCWGIEWGGATSLSLLARPRSLRWLGSLRRPAGPNRLGVISLNPRQIPGQDSIFDELRRHGFVEGKNLIVDGRGYEARLEQLPVIATQLAKADVEAILCVGPAATRAALIYEQDLA